LTDADEELQIIEKIVPENARLDSPDEAQYKKKETAGE
jgi:hypothetical protein